MGRSRGLKMGKPQVPPLRFAPVGMTILLRGKVLRAEALAGKTELSSRPERSAVEGPAVVTGVTDFPRSLNAQKKYGTAEAVPYVPVRQLTCRWSQRRFRGEQPGSWCHRSPIPEAACLHLQAPTSHRYGTDPPS